MLNLSASTPACSLALGARQRRLAWRFFNNQPERF